MNISPQQNFTESGSRQFDLSDSTPVEEFGQSKNGKYVVFSTGAEFFAVASESVSEVVQILNITPLSNLPEWLLGIADLRGTIISVVNFSTLLDLPNAAVSPKAKFIVLQSPNFPSPVAFAVDKLSEIINLPDEEIHIPGNEASPFLFGRAMYRENALKMLNPEILLSSLTLR